MEYFWKVPDKNERETSGEVLRELLIEEVLGCTHVDNVQGTQLLYAVSIVLSDSDAVVCRPCVLQWGVTTRGAAIVRFLLFSIRRVRLFCSSYRVTYTTTGGAMLSGGMISMCKRCY